MKLKYVHVHEREMKLMHDCVGLRQIAALPGTAVESRGAAIGLVLVKLLPFFCL